VPNSILVQASFCADRVHIEVADFVFVAVAVVANEVFMDNKQSTEMVHGQAPLVVRQETM
jgi:hypothetical protein